MALCLLPRTTKHHRWSRPSLQLDARPLSIQPICPIPPAFEANTQLRRLVKSDRLLDARQLFDRMPHRDEVSYTTIISGYVRASDPAEALSLFSRLRADTVLAPDPFVISVSLKACASRPSLRPLGASIHAQTLKSGSLRSSIFVASALLDMYAKTSPHDPAAPLRVFEEMPARNVVSWTAVITALVRAGSCTDAVRCFAKMRASGVPWDSHTYAIALKACAAAGLLPRGREIHAHAAKLGFDGLSFVANSLAAMYARCGSPRDAFALFDRMPAPDVVAWTTAISTYVQMGRDADAVLAFARMVSHTCEAARPNDYTYAAVVSACAGLARADWGEQLHAHVTRCGFAGAMSVANALLTMYARAGRLASADTMFQEMTERDVVSWSAAISAYTQEGHVEESFELFRDMRSSGLWPNEFALASLLSACACAAALKPGREVHAQALALGLEHDAMVGSAIVNMYSKCGSIQDAQQAFFELETDDVVSWTAMINGYAEHGCSVEAMELFDKMSVAGLVPDYVTFIGVLGACSHAGLVDVGYKYFNSMRSAYGIEPGREHYGCMVDLLGRAGCLRDAEKLIEEMPQRPDDVVWSALLRACQMHGDADLGRRAAKKILELHPECAGTHITLSNIYSTKRRWQEAAEARKLMRAKGVKKEVGWSWVDVGDGGVSVFVAGDRMHPNSDDIYDILELLLVFRRRLIGHDTEIDSFQIEIEAV